jgi:peptide-methionine (S)-S-oxide reductase
MTSFLSRLFRPLSTTSAPAYSVTPRKDIIMPDNAQKATVAAGCFWGVEHLYRKHYGNGKGLIDAKVGYAGGHADSPTYRAVCSGNTGHAEALQVTFDPSVVSYRQLLEFFYRMHDPTTKDRQGGDVGTQYRSAIFTHDEEQSKIAKEITDKVGKEWYKQPVTTQIVAAGQWWDAEEYHQLYLHNNPGGYECPAHFLRSFPPLSD